MVGEVTQSIDTGESKNSNSICYQLAVRTQHVWLHTSLASPALNARKRIRGGFSRFSDP
jgi:hypothetical protein